MHEPLSQKLAQVLRANPGPDGITLNDLLERTEGRGFYLVIIVLALPFIVPLGLPGLSTVLGLTVSLLGFRLAFGQTPRLPRFMGDRRLSPALQARLLVGGVKFLRLVERWVKPRRTPWMATRWARCANALLISCLGLLLALPFPPVPPLTNTLPCYCIILVAASMMEEDGVMIWFAYALSLGTILYLVIMVEVLEKVIVHGYHTIRRWLQQ